MCFKLWDVLKVWANIGTGQKMVSSGKGSKSVQVQGDGNVVGDRNIVTGGKKRTDD